MGKLIRNIPSVGNAEFDWSLYEDGWNGASLKVNANVKTGEKHCKVYSHDSYAASLIPAYLNQATPVSKELRKDTIVNITGFTFAGKDTVLAAINGGANNVVIDLNKEQKFFNTISLGDNQRLNKESFLECLKDPEVRKAIIDMGLVAKVGTDVEKASIWDGYVENLSNEMKAQIRKNSIAYRAKVISSNPGGFVVEVADTIKAFMPGSMAAANKLTDYDALIGKTLDVMVESFDKKLGFVVSRKKYLKTTTPAHLAELGKMLKENVDTILTGTVTGTTPFGIFVELEGFGGALTGMIHKTLMDDTLREMLRQESANRGSAIKSGDEIKVYVHKIEKGRIILSNVASAERDAVIEKREAEDVQEKISYAASKHETRAPKADNAEVANA